MKKEKNSKEVEKDSGEEEAKEKTKEDSKENSKKETKEKSQESETLEKIIIEEIPFHANQVIENNFSPPVLNEVEEIQREANLETGLGSESSGNNQSNQFEYSQNVSQNIHNAESEYYSPPVLRPVFNEQSGKNFLLDSSESEISRRNEMSSEMISPGEFTQETRRLPFEREERKYKSVKLK